MKKYFVYELIDPRDGVVFYVGKGTRKTRPFDHISDANRDKRKQDNPLKCNKINSIISAGCNIKIDIVQRFDAEADALLHEADLIFQYGRLVDGSGILTNIQLGGQQPPKRPTKQLYAFNSQLKLEYIFDSTFHAADKLDVTVSVIQNCCAGRCKTTKGLALFYYIPGDDVILDRFTRQSGVSQPIYQFDKEHTLLNVFDSIKQAAEYIRSNTNGISDAIRSKHIYKGFYWSKLPPPI